MQRCLWELAPRIVAVVYTKLHHFAYKEFGPTPLNKCYILVFIACSKVQTDHTLAPVDT